MAAVARVALIGITPALRIIGIGRVIAIRRPATTRRAIWPLRLLWRIAAIAAVGRARRIRGIRRAPLPARGRVRLLLVPIRAPGAPATGTIGHAAAHRRPLAWSAIVAWRLMPAISLMLRAGAWFALRARVSRGRLGRPLAIWSPGRSRCILRRAARTSAILGHRDIHGTGGMTCGVRSAIRSRFLASALGTARRAGAARAGSGIRLSGGRFRCSWHGGRFWRGSRRAPARTCARSGSGCHIRGARVGRARSRGFSFRLASATGSSTPRRWGGIGGARAGCRGHFGGLGFRRGRAGCATPRTGARTGSLASAICRERGRHRRRSQLSGRLPVLSRRFLAPRATACYWSFLIFWHIGLLKRYGTAWRSPFPPYPARKNRG